VDFDSALHRPFHIWWTLIQPYTRLFTSPSQAPVYWRNAFRALASAKQLVEYVVLDIEPLGPATAKHTLAEAQVRTSLG